MLDDNILALHIDQIKKSTFYKYQWQSNIHLKQMKFIFILIEEYLWKLTCLYYLSPIFYVILINQ